MKRIWLICLALACANALIYTQVRHHPFINFDDAQYVSENPQVRQGLTAGSIRWAFTTPHAGNWHPLTWISHMTDVELFGLDPGRHHLASVALHALNSVLLFLVLHGMTGAAWRSAFVAALFAVHPTHVESVAWIAERKDVLSTLFWLLTMAAYAWYARAPSPARYTLVALCLAAGLMAKPMVVTLPFVLLLLDVWPLRRILVTPARRLIVEKLPLFALAAASSVITFLVQREAGAVKALDALPLPRRMATSLVACAEYIGKTLWPADLALLYPHPATVPWVAAGVAAVALGGLTLAAVRAARSHPSITVGWFWFLATLLPVIGLVQVGSQRIADRYTYIPTIGLFMMLAWGLAEAARRWRVAPGIAGAAAVLVLSAHGLLAHRQAGRWASSISIWEHTVAVTVDNARAHTYLGHALAAQGRDDEAAAHYDRALLIHPDSPETLNNAGALLARQGDDEAAIVAFRRALDLAPTLPHARNNLALALMHAGRPAEAVEHFAAAASEEPADAGVRRRLGVALAMSGRHDEAITAYTEAIRLAPGDAVTRNALGAALGAAGRHDAAVTQYAEAVRLDPGLLEARANLGRTLLLTGRADEGKRQLYDLAVRLLRDGQLEPALQELETVLRHDPQYLPARALLVDLAARARAGRGEPR